MLTVIETLSTLETIFSSLLKSEYKTKSYTHKKKKPTTGFLNKRARDGVRTRDPDLGKVVLYQLSHSRKKY